LRKERRRRKKGKDLEKKASRVVDTVDKQAPCILMLCSIAQSVIGYNCCCPAQQQHLFIFILSSLKAE